MYFTGDGQRFLDLAVCRRSMALITILIIITHHLQLMGLWLSLSQQYETHV